MILYSEVTALNLEKFDFDDNTKELLPTLEINGRIPHAVILECENKESSAQIANFLSMFAVCKQLDKPCNKCNDCHKAKTKIHPDIYYAQPEKKSKTYSVEQMRNIIKDAYILPNEADSKVYVFEQADVRLSAVTQNAFLKLLEEPPKNVHFILTCENSGRLLITIRSRCTIIKLKNKSSLDEEILQISKDVVNGILSMREYDLLSTLKVIADKEKAVDILTATSLILRDGLVISSGGKALIDEDLGRKLGLNFTKQKIIALIQLTEKAKEKIKLNININLLATWLCGEYRRISWQR